MYIAIAVILLMTFVYLAVKWTGVALLTSLPACLLYAALLWADVENNTGSEAALFITVLVFPVTLIIITVMGAKTNVHERQWPHLIVFWFWRICFYLVVLTILSLILNVVGVVIWFLCMMFEYRIHVANRHSVSLDIVSTIGSCVRQNLPLAMAMETAADGYKGKRKQIFRNISKWLTEGYSLASALKMGYPKCPTYITSMIEEAENVNQLPEAIRSIEAEIEGKSDESKKIRPIHPTYPVVVVSVAVTIMLGLTIFIIPTFAEVLDDVSGGEESLPRSTEILIEISDFCCSGNGIVVIAIFALIISVNAGLPWIREVYRNSQRKINNPGLITRTGDFIKWHLPILHWFEFNYSIMRVAGLVRVSLAAGCPVNDSIRRAENLDLNNCFRKRLSRWALKVEQGQNVSAAALDTGMGNSLAWAFDEKINAGNTPEILGMLEKFYRSSYNFKVNLVRAIGLPFIIVLLSAMVGFIVFAMFSPLVSIITYFTETALP